MDVKKTIVTQMNLRQRQEWKPLTTANKRIHKMRLLRKNVIFAAAFLCVGAGAFYAIRHPQSTQSVMSHLTAGFEYDETLGRLQFVSNALPQSAMVFLSSDYSVKEVIHPPVNDAQIMHAWSQSEPWIEYACVGDVSACQDGEVMTIVKNHQDEYTVRLLHADGYESVYSGLHTLQIKENDDVLSGQAIGTAAGLAAFEIRRDGLSILPVFEEQ